MGLLLAFLLSFIPALLCACVVYWIDRYEKEPRLLLGAVFAWGALVATMGSILAQMVLQGGVRLIARSEAAAEFTGLTVIAPLTEESLKGLALLLIFFRLRREFDSVLDGIVYGGVVALGFAATENVLYLYWAGYRQYGQEGLLILFLVRVIMGAWNHPLYTAFTGIGLAVARLSGHAPLRATAPLLGGVLAAVAHALHNSLVALLDPRMVAVVFLVDWIGWLFMIAIIAAAILHEGRLVRRHLADEVELGTMTQNQYRTAGSSLAQTRARLCALRYRRLGATTRFYQKCGELAHKKHHFAKGTEEVDNRDLIRSLQAELRTLSPAVAA